MIDALLEEHLAACIQVMPVQSFYRWQGKINRDDEKLVLIKTKRSLYAEVEASILAHHSYDTPEVILLPIERGSVGYMDWIAEAVCR